MYEPKVNRVTHRFQIAGDEYYVDTAGAHLIYHQEGVYHVTANNEKNIAEVFARECERAHNLRVIRHS